MNIHNALELFSLFFGTKCNEILNFRTLKFVFKVG